MRTETLRFPNKNTAFAVWSPADAEAGDVVTALSLDLPRAVLGLHGGTSNNLANEDLHLNDILQNGLISFAAKEGITIFTGGTDAGIFKQAAVGFEKYERSAPCVGVVPASKVSLPGDMGTNVQLEPHHSHFVLAESKEWGGETNLMYRLITYASRYCKSVDVFAGGGQITLKEMRKDVEVFRPMILLGGSGRTTDAVLNARNDNPSNGQLHQVAEQGNVIAFDLKDGAHNLRDLLRSLLL